MWWDGGYYFMITGLILGISIAVFLTSSIITIAGLSNSIQENMITGAVIGAGSLTSYAIIAGALSFTAIFFIILILKNFYKR